MGAARAAPKPAERAHPGAPAANGTALGEGLRRSPLDGAPSAAHGLPLDKLRGTVHPFEGLPAIVTYHPKILLRSSPNKAKAWADLCLALDTLESPPAP